MTEEITYNDNVSVFLSADIIKVFHNHLIEKRGNYASRSIYVP